MPARAILPLLAILLRAADPPAQESEPRLFSVLSEFGRLARRPLWPGFEPQKIVLEVEDSGRTWLLGHPEPPAEFVPIAGHPDVRVFEGRHESARANGAVELAGAPVAIASFQGRSDVPASLAALLLHEA